MVVHYTASNVSGYSSHAVRFSFASASGTDILTRRPSVSSECQTDTATAAAAQIVSQPDTESVFEPEDDESAEDAEGEEEQHDGPSGALVPVDEPIPQIDAQGIYPSTACIFVAK